MRIFKNKIFAEFAVKEKIAERELCEAIARAERGLIDADLGGGVIKQRIARRNRGRSGGFRSLILFRVGERAIFAFGFAKNQRENVSAVELKVLRKLAGELLVYDDEQLRNALAIGMLIEVKDEENLCQ